MSIDLNKTVKVAFTCLDWRLHPQVEEYFSQNGQGCDLCVTAGSIKDLIEPQTQNFFLKQIEISKKLHNCAGVVLTMHLDCGAYCGAAAFENKAAEIANAKNELKKAKDIVMARFSGLPIETYIIDLEKSGAEWKISPEKIEI
jgi:hypothetical protein